MNWLRSKLRQWLKINRNEADIKKLFKLNSNLTNIGIDVHFKSQHVILIFSKLKGGQIRQIDANFRTMEELNSLARELKEKYKPRYVFHDLPCGIDKRWLS